MDKYGIVKRLEYCADNKCDICQEENGSGFPWIDGRCYGFTERLYDALAMLKEQEPVEPKKVKRYIDFDGEGQPYTPETYDCGACGNELPWKANYCTMCGRAVKWE